MSELLRAQRDADQQLHDDMEHDMMVDTIEELTKGVRGIDDVTALEHQVYRNHPYNPAGCSECALTQQIVERTRESIGLDASPTPSPAEVCVKCGSAKDNPAHVYSILNPEAHEFTLSAPEQKPLPKDVPCFACAEGDHHRCIKTRFRTGRCECPLCRTAELAAAVPAAPAPAQEECPECHHPRSAFNKMLGECGATMDDPTHALVYSVVLCGCKCPPVDGGLNVDKDVSDCLDNVPFGLRSSVDLDQQEAAVEPVSSPPERVKLTPLADGFICDAPTPSMASTAEAGKPIEYARVRPAGEQARIPVSAHYWFDKARSEESPALRLSYMEEAYNHVVNALLARPTAPPHDWARLAAEAGKKIAHEINGGDRRDCSYPPELVAILDDPAIVHEEALAKWATAIILSAGVAAPQGRPKIICLCGSTRFVDTWINEYQRLSDEGNIVLTVARMPPRPNLQHDEPELKQRLDELHKRKIDLADEVYVLDVGGYIGDSTRGEIQYAKANNKPITYLSAVSAAPQGDTAPAQERK